MKQWRTNIEQRVIQSIGYEALHLIDLPLLLLALHLLVYFAEVSPPSAKLHAWGETRQRKQRTTDSADFRQDVIVVR